MTRQESLAAIFGNFQDYINADQDIREEIRGVVRNQEQNAREILTLMQSIHQPDGIEKVQDMCKVVRGKFNDVKIKFDELAVKIPKDQYYRFHDHWRFVTQRLSFLAALLVYLESERLIEREETAKLLGVKVRREEGFHMDLDDYLMGLLLLASELSRFSVNVVTAGDYGRPMRIAKFMNELDSGFRLLNLKNDSLRKKYDGLKYDLKKVEEVVYDVSIRGLKVEQHNEHSS